MSLSPRVGEAMHGLAPVGWRNVASSLRAAAVREPDRAAVIEVLGRDAAGRPIDLRSSFHQLDADSDAIAAGLHAQGITPGARVLLMVPPGREFFALVFGLLRARVTPIVVDPGIGPRAIAQACRESRPSVMIGVRKALLAQRLLGFGRASIENRILTGPSMPGLGPVLKLEQLRALGRERGPLDPAVVEPEPGELAAVLFTSGSTGPPKGVCYTHEIFHAQIAIFRQIYAIEWGEIDLCTFPLFALYAPALGMTAVTPRMDPTRPGRVDPRRILEPLADYKATNLFGSPALLRRLVDGADRAGVRFPTLRRIVSAGAPASPRTLERLAPLLDPPAAIHTPYGATEALPVASISSREILGETRHATDQGLGVCVGRPVGQLDVAVIPLHDQPIDQWSENLRLPPGAIGEIAVAGPVVTRQYDQRPEATRAAKIPDGPHKLFHRMGDVGRIDDQGRIWFLGRKSHRVQLGETTLFTIACEGIFNTHPEVARSALVAAQPRKGQVIPVLWVEPVRPLGPLARARLRRELLELASRHSHTKPIQTILFRASFPVDARHNSKIFREKLAFWASRALS